MTSEVLLHAAVLPFRMFRRLRGGGMLRRALVRLRSTATVTTRKGFDMRLDLRDDMQWTLFLRRGWEEPEAQAIEAVVRPGAVFYDIGANVGYYTLLASRLVGTGGRVVSFEPIVNNRARLQANLNLNGVSNVTVVEAGLSDHAQILTASFPRSETGMASIRTVAGATHSEQIRLERGDDLASALGLPPPDVIKIDVEGAEFKALSGMPRLLGSASAVLVEVTPPYLEELGASATRLRDLLADHGFTEHQVVSRIRCWLDDGTEFEQTNEIFSKPGHPGP